MLPLDPAPEQMQEMGEAALAYMIEFLRQQPDLPAGGESGGLEAARALRESPPEVGGEFKPLMETVELAAARSYGTTGPGYLAFIPGGGLFTASLGDLLATGINRFVNLWSTAPIVAQIEYNVVRWLCDLFGYPEASRGILTSGGSMANFSGIVAARKANLSEDFLDGALYVSDQVHASVTKAAALAGFPERSVRIVPTTPELRMDVDRLRDMVGTDRRAGLRPFLVVASAGTTNTGAVDPLDEVADSCEREGLWHHVDGAYGAFFYLCDDLRGVLRGLSRADSLTLDPHKGMFLPYGTGALLVRDGAALRAAHEAAAAYLPAAPDSDEFYDAAQYGPDLSRSFPGLRVWLSVKLFGSAAFRAAIAEKRQLALDAWRRVRALPGIAIDAEPELSLFAFHLTWPGATRAEEDAATKMLLEKTTARGRVMITGCTTKGRVLARVCVLSFRTHQRQIDALVEDLTASIGEIVPSRSA